MTAELLDFAALHELEAQIGRFRLERVVGIQLIHGRALIEKLAALEADSEPQAVRLIAHQIAGSCGSVGMIALSEAATSLEISILSGTAIKLGPIVESLRQLGAESHDALEAAFPKSG